MPLVLHVFTMLGLKGLYRVKELKKLSKPLILVMQTHLTYIQKVFRNTKDFMWCSDLFKVSAMEYL